MIDDRGEERWEMDVPLVILLLEGLHVLSDVSSEDVLLEDLSVELLGLRVESRESKQGQTKAREQSESQLLELLEDGTADRENRRAEGEGTAERDAPVLGVRNEDSSVRGSLHGTEDSVSGGGPLESNIEEALERTGGVLLVELLGEDEGTIGLGDSLVLVGEAELDEGSSSAKETSGVSWTDERANQGQLRASRKGKGRRGTNQRTSW